MRSLSVLLAITLAAIALPCETRAATVVVNEPDTFDSMGSGQCSLLRAVKMINAGTDLYATFHECTFTGAFGVDDRILFALGAGTPTLTISSNGVTYQNLPPIVKPVVIDGGSGGATRVELVPGTGASGSALQVASPDVVLRNLVVGGFGPVMIDAGNTGRADNLVIEGCYVGTGPSGNTAHGLGGFGVRIQNATNVVIGGATPAQRNVISANGNYGLDIGFGASNVLVIGNTIGLGADGATPLGNCASSSRCAGVVVERGAHDITIGMGDAATRNVISSNHFDGIRVVGTGLMGDDPAGVTISGNYIGVAADGVTPRGNVGGILDNTCGVRIGAFNTNPIHAVSGNVVANNQYCGVLAQFSGPFVSIEGNSIRDNGSIGIDLSATLDGDGTTVNDSNGHADGPNRWQNRPVLTSVPRSADGKTFTFTSSLSSPDTPNAQVTVDLYANDSGGTQGATFVGSVIATTNASGNATLAGGPFNIPFAQPDVTATATTAFGTSEFSTPLTSVSAVLFSDGFE